jgi:hypothetical protein
MTARFPRSRSYYFTAVPTQGESSQAASANDFVRWVYINGHSIDTPYLDVKESFPYPLFVPSLQNESEPENVIEE